MHDALRRQAETNAALATAVASTAIMEEFDGAFVVVTDHLGEQQRYRWAGTVVPAPGDAVQVIVQDGQHIVTGRTMPTPSQGKVLSVSGQTVRVEVAVGPSPIEAAYTYANPRAGDVVALAHGYDGYLASGVTSAPTPPPPPKPPADTETKTTKKQVFRARIAGNWRNGDWGSGRPIVSDYRVAAWHYGDILGKTLPDDGEILRCRMYLPTTQVLYPNAPIVQALAAPPPSQAGAGPTGVLPARQGWVDIPRQVAEQLRAGNRGIRLSVNSSNGGGTHDMYKPLSEDPLSGALEITWRS